MKGDMPIENKVSEYDYRNFYDDKCYQIVNNLYSKEINKFDYEF